MKTRFRLALERYVDIHLVAIAGFLVVLVPLPMSRVYLRFLPVGWRVAVTAALVFVVLQFPVITRAFDSSPELRWQYVLFNEGLATTAALLAGVIALAAAQPHVKPALARPKSTEAARSTSEHRSSQVLYPSE